MRGNWKSDTKDASIFPSVRSLILHYGRSPMPNQANFAAPKPPPRAHVERQSAPARTLATERSSSMSGQCGLVPPPPICQRDHTVYERFPWTSRPICDTFSSVFMAVSFLVSAQPPDIVASGREAAFHGITRVVRMERVALSGTSAGF
jgi:hypothetical protein